MNTRMRWLTMLALWLLAAVAQAGTVTYVYTDPQGTPLAEANASGTIIATYDYAPYGQAVTSMSGAPNGPGYTGHVNDPDTGLVYMQARYYDPVVGRFLSADPVTPSPGNTFNFNRYDYASNNPINHIDPDGRKVVLNGDTDFKRETKVQLKELKATSTGKQVVTTLEKSKHIFTISENKGSSHATPDNEANAQNGKGTGGTIAHDPKWTPAVMTPSGPASTPSKVVLGHELAHAMDYDKGTLDRSINPSTGVRRSEEKAMGVENKIRQEMKLPERTVY